MKVLRESLFKKKSRKTVLKAEDFPCKQRLEDRSSRTSIRSLLEIRNKNGTCRVSVCCLDLKQKGFSQQGMCSAVYFVQDPVFISHILLRISSSLRQFCRKSLLPPNQENMPFQTGGTDVFFRVLNKKINKTINNYK